MSPEVLGRAIASLPPQKDPRLVVGFDLADDAGVVRLGDGRCLVQTLDFFTPIVDDPWTFGAIAATNALSDVYAMGGVPLSAMNILCWPDGLGEDVLAQLLKGGADKVREAGAVLVGGHSVSDKELKFGLSVTGLVDESAVWTNAGARPGDVLVLTKALGTGIISTAIKRGKCPPESQEASIAGMLQLNDQAAAAATHVHACTDITGFGLAGHAWEMARGSGVRVHLQSDALPLLPHALRLAGDRHLTRGEKSNRRLVGDALRWGDVSAALQSVVVDPQTSGGLLLSVPPEQAEALVALGYWRVGHVEAGEPALVVE